MMRSGGLPNLMFRLMVESPWDRATGLVAPRYAARPDEIPMFIKGLHEALDPRPYAYRSGRD